MPSRRIYGDVKKGGKLRQGRLHERVNGMVQLGSSSEGQPFSSGFHTAGDHIFDSSTRKRCILDPCTVALQFPAFLQQRPYSLFQRWPHSATTSLKTSKTMGLCNDVAGRLRLPPVTCLAFLWCLPLSKQRRTSQSPQRKPTGHALKSAQRVLGP